MCDKIQFRPSRRKGGWTKGVGDAKLKMSSQTTKLKNCRWAIE